MLTWWLQLHVQEWAQGAQTSWQGLWHLLCVHCTGQGFLQGGHSVPPPPAPALLPLPLPAWQGLPQVCPQKRFRWQRCLQVPCSSCSLDGSGLRTLASPPCCTSNRPPPPKDSWGEESFSGLVSPSWWVAVRSKHWPHEEVQAWPQPSVPWHGAVHSQGPACRGAQPLGQDRPDAGQASRHGIALQHAHDAVLDGKQSRAPATQHEHDSSQVPVTKTA